MAEVAGKKKRTFRKFSYRGIDLDQLIDLTTDQFVELVHCRARRKFVRGIRGKPLNLLKRLRKSRQGLAEGEKPQTVKTHLRNMVIVPEMTGHYLGEFSITYKPVRHGRPGVGGTTASR